jgi:hypothetical protein
MEKLEKLKHFLLKISREYIKKNLGETKYKISYWNITRSKEQLVQLKLQLQ